MSGTMPSSSSSSSQSERGSGGMTIDIRPMIEDVSQVMTKHITSILSGVIGEYTIYKETHDTIMGLPCVRKLQERISELEQHCGGGEGGCGASMSASSMTTNTGGGSREEEVAQLQSAIADLNRYIHALESKVDMKSVSSGDGGHIQQQHHHHQDEESVRLEIHETDDGDEGEGDDDHCESTVETLSTHKNVIITTEALEETETEAEAEEAEQEVEQEEAEQEEAEPEQEAAEADAEAAEADAEAEEAEDAEADAEAEDAEADAEAEEEAEDAEAEAEEAEDAEDAEQEDAEQEDAEADAEAEDAEADAEAEEETEEVEEVKIKGKTYFTTNPQNGIIYACVDDDVGDEVGVFKNGVAVFNKGKK